MAKNAFLKDHGELCLQNLGRSDIDLTHGVCERESLAELKGCAGQD